MLCKHKDLNLDPQYPLKNLGVKTCISNSKAGDWRWAETGISLELIGQPALPKVKSN